MNNNKLLNMQCNETTGRIMRPVAYIKSDFTSKFGIPRQSGLADLETEIHFYRNTESGSRERAGRILPPLADLEFSRQSERMVPDRASAKTGRKHKSRRLRHPLPVPPKPDRTLQCAAYRRYIESSDGPVIHIQGADLLDGTPIYDIKPYIPYADSHPEARGSFATAHRDDHLQVQFPPELLNKSRNKNKNL